MADKKIAFQLVFDENLKKDTNLPTTERLAFDDIGDFVEEREKIKRLFEKRNQSALKVDYSDFENHVFFDSAVKKSEFAADRVLNKFPFNGNSEDKDAFFLTSSGFEEHVFDTWPRFVGHTFFDGVDQFASASDPQNKLWMGSSSLYVSVWTDPVITDQNIVLQVMSSSVGPLNKQGYELFFSGATDPHVKFSLYSGSEVTSVSASYTESGFNNVAAIYDTNQNMLSLYINKDRVVSSSVSFGNIEFGSTAFLVGSGSQHTAPSSSFDFYSGSLDEIRVFHTSSDLFHVKNFSRPVDAEEYSRLRWSFNEGVTGFDNVDSVIIDYSKGGLHGTYLNYDSSISRVSASVMLQDPGDPILYSFHSDVADFTGSLALSGTLYDLNNNNNIFNLIAEGVLFEDGEIDGLLSDFTLAMARFFDDIKLYMDQFVNLRVTNYDGFNETPDLFLPHLKRYFGWKVSEHYNDANPLEYLFGENILASGSLEVPLVEIRNQFWRRILNNFPLLMKSKGTRSNIDYLFNVLGLNKENVIIKEYGYLPGTSIQDERIAKTKVERRLGIGTGSLGSVSSSFVRLDESVLWTGGGNISGDFDLEIATQLPFVSASYSGSILSGALWQIDNVGETGGGASGSARCYWVRDSLASETGKIVLESSGSNIGNFILSSSNLTIFNGDWIHVNAGRDVDNMPFISVRGIEGCDLTLSEDFVGSTNWFIEGGSTSHNLYVGANTSSFLYPETLGAQGFFGEFRFWDKKLSGSEVDDHAFNYQSVGTEDPLGLADVSQIAPLRVHWALNEDLQVDSAGDIVDIVDLSRNGRNGTGFGFPASIDPYDKFLLDYNYLSPTVDLKWTENKVRIRNKTELVLEDQAIDTNEVSLEFNLVDALNEDIVKIFSTLDEMNNFIGQPIFKYRDEYSDLEGVRKAYFNRLGDSLNFSRFFSLFRWFDKKVSESIKQILPARAKFIGGEQVIESHMLERPRYKYQYPIFRTPQDPPEGVVDASIQCEAANMVVVEGGVLPRDDSAERSNIIQIDADCVCTPVSTYGSGDERVDRNKDNFFRLKVNGDQKTEILNPNTAVNFRNEFAKRIQQNKDRDNE